MEPDQSQHLYTILFDERQEGWYVRIDSSSSPQGLPLSRSSLQRLVSLYNEIHRGAPLTLIDRRAMEELGEERRDLDDTVRTLYDYIDTQTMPSSSPLASLTGPLRWRISLRGLLDAIVTRLSRALWRNR